MSLRDQRERKLDAGQGKGFFFLVFDDEKRPMVAREEEKCRNEQGSGNAIYLVARMAACASFIPGPPCRQCKAQALVEDLLVSGAIFCFAKGERVEESKREWERARQAERKGDRKAERQKGV